MITLEKVYNYHLVPEVLSADEAKHIKGVQANLWTEYMSALDEMEYMLYPRVAALSEVAWRQKRKIRIMEDSVPVWRASDGIMMC